MAESRRLIHKSQQSLEIRLVVCVLRYSVVFTETETSLSSTEYGVLEHDMHVIGPGQMFDIVSTSSPRLR